jgi:hypothetical protein
MSMLAHTTAVTTPHRRSRNVDVRPTTCMAERPPIIHLSHDQGTAALGLLAPPARTRARHIAFVPPTLGGQPRYGCGPMTQIRPGMLGLDMAHAVASRSTLIGSSAAQMLPPRTHHGQHHCSSIRAASMAQEGPTDAEPACDFTSVICSCCIW